MITFLIVIPIFNVEEYIKESLDSLIAQSYGNFKAILVNDGSTDNSGKIAQTYCKNDSRFICISQENQGVSSARNTALNYIATKIAIGGGQNSYYVAFLDSDDYLESNALSHIADIINKNNIDTLISNKSFLATSNNDKSLFDYKIFKRKLENHIFTPQELLKISPRSKITTTWAFVFKWEVLQNLYFPSDIYCGEDIIFCTSATLKSRNIYIDSTPIYHYRIRENSLVQSKNDTKKADSSFKIANIFYKKLRNESNKHIRKFYKYNIKQSIKDALFYAKNCHYENLSFAKKDLAKFMTFMGLKYRFYYYFS